MSSLGNQNIIIGITGGIAAYKSLSLIRLFKAHHFNVKVVATRHALEFVTPLTIETLSQNKLYVDCFERAETPTVEHISLADWADVTIIAPATANIIGKFANGVADDALSTLLLATHSPLFIAPAMNVNMLENPFVAENINKLTAAGVHIIHPTSGFLACGTEAKGRMVEPEQIFETVLSFLNNNQRLNGKSALVTAGPTYEPIDPVRFIGNHSSGLMGFALAEELANQGATVKLIAGPTHLSTQHPRIECIRVTTAAQMCEQCLTTAPHSDIIVMSAAVADYTPKVVATEKIKKNNDSLQLELVKTTDILKTMGASKRDDQYLVGFALETENELANGKAKLHNKNADLIVLNSTKNEGAGFGTVTNLVTMLTKEGEIIEGSLKDKKIVAADIVNLICSKLDSKK